eukprot:1322737-Rhodomonas_salina.5
MKCSAGRCMTSTQNASIVSIDRDRRVIRSCSAISRLRSSLNHTAGNPRIRRCNARPSSSSDSYSSVPSSGFDLRTEHSFSKSAVLVSNSSARAVPSTSLFHRSSCSSLEQLLVLTSTRAGTSQHAPWWSPAHSNRGWPTTYKLHSGGKRASFSRGYWEIMANEAPRPTCPTVSISKTVG